MITSHGPQERRDVLGRIPRNTTMERRGSEWWRWYVRITSFNLKIRLPRRAWCQGKVARAPSVCTMSSWLNSHIKRKHAGNRVRWPGAGAINEQFLRTVMEFRKPKFAWNYQGILKAARKGQEEVHHLPKNWENLGLMLNTITHLQIKPEALKSLFQVTYVAWVHCKLTCLFLLMHNSNNYYCF